MTATFWRLLTCSLVLVLVHSGSAGRRDPLILPSGEFPQYQQLWSSLLEVTPYDCGRLVVLPAFEPEASISIYCVRGGTSGKTNFRVTWISTDKNLWQKTTWRRPEQAMKNVKVRRIDADIPAETALLLRNVWTEMLGSVRHGLESQHKDYLVLDSTRFIWSIQRSSGPPLRAELNRYIEITPEMASFAHLTEALLTKYCHAPSSQRTAILKEIGREAKRLPREKR